MALRSRHPCPDRSIVHGPAKSGGGDVASSVGGGLGARSCDRQARSGRYSCRCSSASAALQAAAASSTAMQAPLAPPRLCCQADDGDLGAARGAGRPGLGASGEPACAILPLIQDHRSRSAAAEVAAQRRAQGPVTLGVCWPSAPQGGRLQNAQPGLTATQLKSGLAEALSVCVCVACVQGRCTCIWWGGVGAACPRHGAPRGQLHISDPKPPSRAGVRQGGSRGWKGGWDRGAATHLPSVGG